MVDGYLRQSPLAHLHLEARATNDPTENEVGVEMGERQLLGMINLRAQKIDPVLSPAITKVLGLELPTNVNTVSGRIDGIYTLCLGPDEWLIVTPSNKEQNLYNKLTQALEQLHTSINLVGESRTVIRLSGLHARNVLAKGCSVDLHPRVFKPGQCAQTILGRSDITVHQVAHEARTDAATYDIIVFRSFAEYVWTWLEDAAREYGVRVVIHPS